MPGLDLIRNHLIKPLLFATEKVVEHYIGHVAEPVQEPQPVQETKVDTTLVSNQAANTTSRNSPKTCSDSDKTDELRSRMQKLCLVDSASEISEPIKRRAAP